MDINDNRPTFYPVLYTVSVSTHSAPGTSVVKVTANDPDSGPNGRVTYRTAPAGGSAFFTLNKDTGIFLCGVTDERPAKTFISFFFYWGCSLLFDGTTKLISLGKNLQA